MDVIQSLVYPPRLDHLVIGKYIIIAISFIFGTYLSFLLGSSLLSLIFRVKFHDSGNEQDALFSAELVRLFVGKWWTLFALLVFPLLALMLTYAQTLYGTSIQIVNYLSLVLIGVVAGWLLLYAYQKSPHSNEPAQWLKSVLIGLGGHILLVIASYIYVGSITFIFWPEKWPLIHTPFPILFSAAEVIRFLQFSSLAIALTGAAIAFFFLVWEGGKTEWSVEQKQLVKRLGGGLTMAFTLIQPILFVWILVNIPNFAKSLALFHTVVIVTILLLILNLMVYRFLRSEGFAGSTGIFVLALLLFLGWNVSDHYARESATLETTLELVQQAQQLELEIEAKREAMKPAEAGAEGVALGEMIFNQKCIACHRWDQRLVGPPYLEVLPKYQDNPQALKDFVANPVKINPDYPPMPNQGLKPEEVEAVVEYLLSEFKKRSAQ